jgi:hypothetical protein
MRRAASTLSHLDRESWQFARKMGVFSLYYELKVSNDHSDGDNSNGGIWAFQAN